MTTNRDLATKVIRQARVDAPRTRGMEDTISPYIAAKLDEAGLLTPVSLILADEWGVEAREWDMAHGWSDWFLTIPFLKGRARKSCEAFIEARADNERYEHRLVRRYVTEAVPIETD